MFSSFGHFVLRNDKMERHCLISPCSRELKRGGLSPCILKGLGKLFSFQMEGRSVWGSELFRDKAFPPCVVVSPLLLKQIREQIGLSGDGLRSHQPVLLLPSDEKLPVRQDSPPTRSSQFSVFRCLNHKCGRSLLCLDKSNLQRW